MTDKKVKDISFHYTSPAMVKDLMELVPFKDKDSVLDAGSGANKIWYQNIPNYCKAYECEIEDGVDFFKWSEPISWLIGNPPYDIGWKFTEKAMNIATTGIAFLGSMKFFNQFTPLRLDKMKEKGFELTKIHVTGDRRWYGRYVFLIFEKKQGILTWDRKNY